MHVVDKAFRSALTAAAPCDGQVDERCPAVVDAAANLDNGAGTGFTAQA